MGLAEVLRITPMSYKYNGLAGSQDDNQDYTGVIAPELEKVAPILVQEKKGYLSPADVNQTSVKTVDYNGISMMLVNAVQELNQRLDRIEKENAVLKKENKKLMNRIKNWTD